jgi:S-formylglutathione hydrolase FrmB
VQTYLTADVPAWITSHLQVRPPDRGWAVAGFSEGGTCAIQLATQSPRLYRFFIDISGQAGPTLGSRARTISAAFGGDAAAFARVDPAAVLAHTRFPGSAGVFVAGESDRVYSPQQRAMYAAARRAGMTVTLMYLPGGHDGRVWFGGLQHNVAWLAGVLGITGRAR